MSKKPTAFPPALDDFDLLLTACRARLNAPPAATANADAEIDALLVTLKPRCTPAAFADCLAAVHAARTPRWEWSFDPVERLSRTLKGQLYAAKRLHLVLRDFTVRTAADPRVAAALAEFMRCMPAKVAREVAAAIRAENPQRAFDLLEAAVPSLKDRPTASDAGTGATRNRGGRPRKENPQDAAIAAAWPIARAAGVRLKDFAKDRGCSPERVEKILSRERQRRRRAKKPTAAD
ncbi:MAG: hypothetical protein AMXMBFR47_13750 [Planctomycetota bacterium]